MGFYARPNGLSNINVGGHAIFFCSIPSTPNRRSTRLRVRTGPTPSPSGPPLNSLPTGHDNCPLVLATRGVLTGCSLFGSLATAGQAAEPVFARDGSGVYGYKDTPKLPWCQWQVHDPDRPAPPRVNPGPAQPPAPAPGDVLVLFGGGDLSAWQTNQWRVEGGEIVAGPSNLVSRATFGDCQIPLEWMAPADFDGPWYDRGNNGVLLMGLYEIQFSTRTMRRLIRMNRRRRFTAKPRPA